MIDSKAFARGRRSPGLLASASGPIRRSMVRSLRRSAHAAIGRAVLRKLCHPPLRGSARPKGVVRLFSRGTVASRRGTDRDPSGPWAIRTSRCAVAEFLGGRCPGASSRLPPPRDRDPERGPQRRRPAPLSGSGGTGGDSWSAQRKKKCRASGRFRGWRLPCPGGEPSHRLTLEEPPAALRRSDGVSIELGDLLVRSNIFTESERQAALSVFAREGSLARVDR
jgi:hypothetical protein